MLNDPKHPFGHGYCLAMVLLNKEVEWNTGLEQELECEDIVFHNRNIKNVDCEEIVDIEAVLDAELEKLEQLEKQLGFA